VLRASPRTVQRRLQELGLTHRELVDQVRRALAPRLLATPRLSLTEVAYLLGFEDVSGFYRAHRRWTGVAPSRRRQRPRV
jgi:AraC-like DNA-binding protein